jgi:predicted TIM-barrel fold metal-dependent hydrolase
MGGSYMGRVECIRGMNYIPDTELVVEKNIIKKPRFEVVDVHGHFGKLVLGDDYENLYDMDETVQILKGYRIKRIANMDGFWGDELDRMLEKTHPYNDDFVITFGGVDISMLDDPGFDSMVEKTLKQSVRKGIKGIKIWKNASLEMKDSRGRKIPIDDDRLRIIWETAAKLGLVVLIHIADPIGFFKPIDGNNERYDELNERPEWSFHGDEYFGFWELMEMQENLLENNPDTTFIVAHGGSCSENLKYVGKCLDRYPNMYIDIAERISEFGRQPYTSRKVFNKYQDRILFGTDFNPQNIDYEANFRFLETFDEYFDYSCKPKPPHGNWKIYGIGLDDEVLKKVYHENAEKVLNL